MIKNVMFILKKKITKKKLFITSIYIHIHIALKESVSCSSKQMLRNKLDNQ